MFTRVLELNAKPGKSKELTNTFNEKILAIGNGKIVAGWDNWDQLGMLQQIGAYTPPEAVTLGKTA